MSDEPSSGRDFPGGGQNESDDEFESPPEDPNDPDYNPANDSELPVDDTVDEESGDLSEGESELSIIEMATQADDVKNSLAAIKNRAKAFHAMWKDHTGSGNVMTHTTAQLLLEDLKALGKDLTTVHTDLFAVFPNTVDPSKPNEPPPLTIMLNDYNTIYNMFFDTRSAVSELVKSMAPTNGTGLKPPKLSLPTFKGVHADWPSFKSSSTALVSDSTKFSPCEKLRLLKDALKGPAEDNVKDLQATDGNWPIAWDRLTSRYDSPREAAHAAVKPLLDLPSLLSQTGNGIHKLLATLRTTRAQIGLIQLGAVTEAEVLYSHFVLARLDAKTIKEFNQTLTTNDVPRLDILTAWLERYAKSIDLTNEIKQGSAGSTQPKRRDHNDPSILAVNQSTRGKGSPPTKQGRSASHKQRRDVLQENTSGQQTGTRSDQKPFPKSASGKAERTKFSCYVCQSEHHRTAQCPEFLGYSLDERRDWTRSHNRCYNCLGDHSVKECTSKYTCAKCKKKHHSLLHNDESVTPIMTVSSLKDDSIGMGVLPTAVVTVTDAAGNAIDQARCLLDSGAERSFITQRAAAQFGIVNNGKTENFIVAGGRTIPSKGHGIIYVRSRICPSKTFPIHVTVLPAITGAIPTDDFEVSDWEHIRNLPLADPQFNRSGQIDVLLGAGAVDDIMRGRKITGPPGTPSAYLTEIGYVMQGRVGTSAVLSITPGVLKDDTPTDPETKASEFSMKKFWEIEEVPQQPVLTPMEEFCEEYFKRTTIRLPDGKFQVKWPFIADTSLLGTSYKAALSRWHTTERKLQQDPGLKADYHGQIEDYIKNGEMELVPYSEMHKTPHFWIPHHPVFKPSSTTTKMRIVFDGSAKTSSGKSINALLAPGPVTQPPLFSQLLAFRWKSVAMTADIRQMYRQIEVDPAERDFARIRWRKDPSGPVQHYRHKTIPFGFASSPYLATRCLKQLADDGKDQFPLAAKAISESFYVDDFLFSEDSAETAIKFKVELLALLGTAHLDLRKWSSNSFELLESLMEDSCQSSPKQQHPFLIQNGDTVGTLGLGWRPSTDDFQFTVQLEDRRLHTKRTVLSDISKIFDPIGLLAPTIILAKIWMQKVWKQDVKWDDPLPPVLLTEWLEFSKGLPDLEKIRVPRWLGYTSSSPSELHGFCDASQDAYAAAVYLRTKNGSGWTCRLIASKSRVAPVKLTTIPRLELQGALLLTELMRPIRERYNVDKANIHYWTDSTIVLHWIYSHPSKFKLYVANRVTQIQDDSKADQWHHVVSEDNPADHSSRGLTPDELRVCKQWWNGPSWLKSEFSIPVFNAAVDSLDSIAKEAKTVLTLTPLNEQYLVQCLSRISSWKKVVHVTAILMGIGELKRFQQQIPLCIKAAELRIVHMIQAAAYPNLLQAIQDNFKQPRFREYRFLKGLSVFLDADGIFRVGGRLKRSNLPYETKHQALLHGSHPLVRALILHAHQALAHGGRLVVHNHLRQMYWIPNATKAIKSVIDKCLLCHRYHAKPTTQLMGQLPPARVNSTRPFLHTGVDFFGPYELRNVTGRNGKYKVWVALFTCMATRAIHLEIVSTLSQQGFLLAFRRFIARRGRPTNMYSDNGTNFVGANAHLQDVIERNANTAAKRITSTGLMRAYLPDMSFDSIKWIFNPPAAPAQGGVWESCVKLVKTHLRKFTNDDLYSWEQFESLLTFIESIVNSRPLTPISEDPHDMEALTPAHFLVGGTPETTLEDDLTHLKLNRLDRYQLVVRRQQELWQRWQQEYVTALQKRTKWQTTEPNLSPGDMVLIIDDQAPPLKWTTGRIKKVSPGADDLVRVATVETKSSYKDVKGQLVKTAKEYVRPISKLARIPIENDEQDPRFEALPYPSRYPAVTTVVKPYRLKPIPAWQWLYGILYICSLHLNPTNATDRGSNSTANSAEGSFWECLGPRVFWWTGILVYGTMMTTLLGIVGIRCRNHKRKIVIRFRDRQRYDPTFHPRQARTGPLPARNGRIWTVVMMAMVTSAMAAHETDPDLRTKAPPCTGKWETSHVIPSSVQVVQWLHIMEDGTVCSRRLRCANQTVISSDAKGCVNSLVPCSKWKHHSPDQLQCQSGIDNGASADRLEYPPYRSSLCTVGGLTLRHCQQFIETFEEVPLAIVGAKVYPLAGLNIIQFADTKDHSAYTCKGRCPDVNLCFEGRCYGDAIFCETFSCRNRDHNTLPPTTDCHCTFNRSSLTHVIPTDKGNVAPSCWGTMVVAVRKEIKEPSATEFPCTQCVLECTDEGIRVVTPGRVSRYVSVHKNPGHVAANPTTTASDIQMTSSMLASTGVITVQIWFSDYDTPSIRTISCPRVPVCKLIKCHICLERWMNVSCYDVYHWVILAFLGLALTAVITCVMYLTKSIVFISWYLSCPVRCLIRIIQRHRYRRSQTHPMAEGQIDAESKLPIKMPNSYGPTTRSTRRTRRTFLLSLVSLCTLLSTTAEACSNFAMMSAATTECDYSQASERTCTVRINTRLAMSPIGQTSCLRINDARSDTLGTITMETQSISLRCEKELLYFAPRPKVKCDSSRQCFNILPNHECTYKSCAKFGVNDTIDEFSHTAESLGWSACHAVLPGCFWPMTHDCHFVRTSLFNPTGQAYTVYNCPQWTYAVIIKVQFHLGQNVTTDTITLYAGEVTSLHRINFT